MYTYQLNKILFHFILFYFTSFYLRREYLSSVGRHKIQYYNIGTILKVWLFRINQSFLNACWVINRVNMLLFKNHKAMTSITGIKEIIFGFFFPFSQIRTKRVHFSPSHLKEYLIKYFIFFFFYLFFLKFLV